MIVCVCFVGLYIGSVQILGVDNFSWWKLIYEFGVSVFIGSLNVKWRTSIARSALLSIMRPLYKLLALNIFSYKNESNFYPIDPLNCERLWYYTIIHKQQKYQCQCHILRLILLYSKLKESKAYHKQFFFFNFYGWTKLN